MIAFRLNGFLQRVDMDGKGIGLDIINSALC